MSTIARTAAMALAPLITFGASSAASQVIPRSYQKGPVTLVTQYRVTPGKLNAFMQDYATNQRKGLEIGKRTGGILNYGAAVAVGRRGGEANVVTLITFTLK